MTEEKLKQVQEEFLGLSKKLAEKHSFFAFSSKVTLSESGELKMSIDALPIPADLSILESPETKLIESGEAPIPCKATIKKNNEAVNVILISKRKKGYTYCLPSNFSEFFFGEFDNFFNT